MQRAVAATALSVLMVGAAGCRSPKLDAQATARAYYRFLAAGRGSQAYELLAPSLKKQISRSRFVRNAKSLTQNKRKEFEKISSSKTLALSATVAMHINDSRTMVWKKDQTGWKLTTNPFDFYPQDSPRRALRSFLAALTHHRYRILLRFVPRVYRKHMNQHDVEAMFQGEQGKRIRKLVTILKDHLDEPIEVKNNEATLVYGDSAKVTLVREEGVWRIRDIL